MRKVIDCKNVPLPNMINLSIIPNHITLSQITCTHIFAKAETTSVILRIMYEMENATDLV